MDEFKDESELTFRKKKKQRRCRCIVAIVVVILVFLLGFIIGYFSRKIQSTSQTSSPASQKANKESRERASSTFQSSVDNLELEKNVRYERSSSSLIESDCAGSGRLYILMFCTHYLTWIWKRLCHRINRSAFWYEPPLYQIIFIVDNWFKIY